jgi:hypothetical protein
MSHESDESTLEHSDCMPPDLKGRVVDALGELLKDSKLISLVKDVLDLLTGS